MTMISNAYASRAMMDENYMWLMIEDSDKKVSEIWVYRDAYPVCKFSLEDNDRVIKEGAIGWDRATALISANRCFDIYYEYYELCDKLIATSIRFHADTHKKHSIVVTDKSTYGLNFIDAPMTTTTDGVMYGVHINGSPYMFWMTLGTECWEHYKEPEVGIKRTGNMQAFDILGKAANGEYKTYEITFNYHIIKDTSDGIKRVVDEVYIKYEEKDEEEDTGRREYRTLLMPSVECDLLNNKATVNTEDGNTYSFDYSTCIHLRVRGGSVNQSTRITFAKAEKILLNNSLYNIRIHAIIAVDKNYITSMYIYCDEAMYELEKLKEENERLRDNIGKQKALINSMYGVSALGWRDMYPTGKMASLKKFAKKCNLTVPECLYCMNDIAATEKIHDSEKEKESMKFLIPKIKKVLYNEPAVIVFWEDDTKTVVRAQDGEPYDKEKGLAMAISKKALGNDRDYYEIFIRSKAVLKPKKGKKKE